MGGKKLMTLAAVLMTATFLGCGSSMDSGGDSSSSDDNVKDNVVQSGYAGADACIDCHSEFSWSQDLVEGYLEGKHVIHSDHITAADEDDGCLVCHDPVGDGSLVAKYIAAANVPAGGLAAVTCEACHGKGAEHYGIGPMPMAIPSAAVCGSCHDELLESHLTYHPEANNIYTNFTASRHNTASIRNEAVCSKCHTDAGGKLYRNVTTRGQLMATVMPVATSAAVQCRTCHDTHNVGEGLLMAEVESHGTVEASAEYATCTTCHQGDNAAVSDNDATDTGLHDQLIYHEDRYYRIISDTHYDDPATTDKIEGYVVNPLSERACRDCHDVHSVMEINSSSTSAWDTINFQWANSGHGGNLAKVKGAVAQAYKDAGNDRTMAQTAAIKMAGSNDDYAIAWNHYDWDDTNGKSSGSSRGSCQRCHTATGAKNFLSAPTTYDAANNDFSHLAGWTINDSGVVTSSSGQNEMLYCWGCHTNNSGGLRDPGAVSPDYLAADGVTDAVFPDINASNICVACHSGRESGGEIKASTSNFTNDTRSFINSHYLSAGGTVFKTTGYEFTGQSYANPSYFGHDKIGMGTHASLTAWETTNGTNGPCVGCHMESDTSHTFMPVEINDSSDKIIAIKTGICVNCHDGSHGVPFTADGGNAADVAAAAAFLETEKEDYLAAMEALSAQMITEGYFFYPNYPYILNASGLNPAAATFRDNGVKTWGATNDIGKNNMGAAFNFNLLIHDPGAYAHNRYYSKRLVYDAIDWLDNELFDESVGATIDGLVGEMSYPAINDSGTVKPATTFTAGQATVAKAYLDGNDSSAAIERP